MRAVMNLQTLGVRSFLRYTVSKRLPRLTVHGACRRAGRNHPDVSAEAERGVKFYTSLPRLADAPSSYAFARDHALS